MFQVVRDHDGWHLRADWMPIESQLESFATRRAAVARMRWVLQMTRAEMVSADA